MRITPVPDKKSKIYTEHRSEKIEWDVAILVRLTADENYDIYEHINAYWATLPAEHQDAIFAVYQEIHGHFERIYSASKLEDALFKPVQKLMRLHQIDHVKRWTDFTPAIFVPSELSEVYIDTQENKITPERTYLRPDYQWLMAMIVAFRAMVPVWGSYIERTEKEVGVNFKEYRAFQLLSHTEIMQSIPMQKLRAFTAQNIWPEKSKPSAIWGFISSEDFPEWIMSLVVVRRLSTADIRGVDPDKHPVKRMFSFVRHRAGTHETSFEGKITEKVFDGAKQEGENNLSVFEGYKNKQERAAGEITPFQWVMEDAIARARQICPDIDLRTIELSLASVTAAYNSGAELQPGQLRLVQYALRTVVVPRGILHLNEQMVNAVAVAQAVLWHRGHHLLAALVSALPIANRDYLSYGTGSPEPYSKANLDELVVLYPFINNPSTKAKSVKQSNAACVAIDSVTEHFAANDWRITLPDEWVSKVTGNRTTRRLSIPRDFKNKMAELAIQLAKRSF